MADITITINTDNDAFCDDEGVELSRILHSLANEVQHRRVRAMDEHRIRDINGNCCGVVEVRSWS